MRECKAFADRNGMTVIATYVDRALSAKTDQRPEFQKMIKDSAKCLFDVVLVWKLDRFSRNRYDSAHNKAILRKNGVKVVSATEPISEDSTGILLESLLEGYAEFYSAELSEKVIRGRTENALKCKFNGGSIPLGYVIDSEQRFQIDPLTSPFVLEAFKLYSEGVKMKSIVDQFNKRGITSMRGGKFSIDILTRLLNNRRYMGEYRYRDIIHTDAIPAIVPPELFERVQEVLAKNKRAPARHKAEDDYLLTTKLFCGSCGAYLVGECGTSGTNRVYHYYKCVKAKKRRGCNRKAVKKNWIEDIVVGWAMKLIMDDSLLERLTDMVLNLQKQENVTLPMLRKQLAEVERGIDNMLNAIQQGVLNSSTKKRLDDLEQAKADIEVKILQEEMQKPLLTREQILFWLHKFRGIDTTQLDQRQRLIDTFVNAVVVYDDKIVITFNYKDGVTTIDLAQISEKFSSDFTASAPPPA